MPTGITTLEL